MLFLTKRQIWSFLQDTWIIHQPNSLSKYCKNVTCRSLISREHSKLIFCMKRKLIKHSLFLLYVTHPDIRTVIAKACFGLMFNFLFTFLHKQSFLVCFIVTPGLTTLSCWFYSCLKRVLPVIFSRSSQNVFGSLFLLTRSFIILGTAGVWTDSLCRPSQWKCWKSEF